LANDGEPADLDGVQAMETVISRNSEVSNTRGSGWVCLAVATTALIMDMMPEHFPFVI